MQHKVILYFLFINKVALKSDAKERTVLEAWPSEKIWIMKQWLSKRRLL